MSRDSDIAVADGERGRSADYLALALAFVYQQDASKTRVRTYQQVQPQRQPLSTADVRQNWAMTRSLKLLMMAAT